MSFIWVDSDMRCALQRQSSVGVRQHEAMIAGARAALEQLIAEWDNQHVTSLQDFIDVQAAKVRQCTNLFGLIIWPFFSCG